MTGATIADIKSKIERHWSRGELCRAALGHHDLFPWSLSLGKPSSKQMLDDFSGTQDWVKVIQTYAKKYDVTVQWESINHRILGAQQLPSALCLETAQQTASLIGKAQQLKQFMSLYKSSIKQLPALEPWFIQHPLKVIDLASSWQKILDLCAWMQDHPHPGIYLRQVDVAGVDSKFIEQHRRILAVLFDVILPEYVIDNDFTGVAGFVQRYGFLDKPVMLRMRPLDDKITLVHSRSTQDVMLTAQAFSMLEPVVLRQVKQVVMVENEINYLAFPALKHALIIFGSGYGFDALKKAKWLHDGALYYWGDLDTHGFAILNQLRSSFPHVQSFLMDKATLVKHQSAWGIEPRQEKKDLGYLNADEVDVYDMLRSNDLGEKIRLEQERIAFHAVQQAVENIATRINDES